MEVASRTAFPNNDLPFNHVDDGFLRGLWNLVLVWPACGRAYACHSWCRPNEYYFLDGVENFDDPREN